MILRAMGLGFVLWLAIAALFRFEGQNFFLPDERVRLVIFVAAPVIGALLAFVFLRLLKEGHGDEGEAAIGIAFPNLLLSSFAVHEFATVFPNLDPVLDGVYGALSMLFTAAILFVGLAMTKLTPQDERV